MTVYTVRQYLGDRYYFAGVGGNGDILDLDCQNTNGYNYATGAVPGSWDAALTKGGNITVSGTFTLTNARANLGTTSLLLPSSGYIRNTTGTSTLNVSTGTISFWIYLNALPASNSGYFVGYSTNSTTLPSNMPNGGAVSIRSDGKLSLLVRFSSADYINVNSTAALTAGAWKYVTVTWSDYNVYFGINGTVELVKTPGTFWSGTNSPFYALVMGDSVLNTAGTYLDDIRVSQFFVPGVYTSNYSVPTQEFATYMQNTKSPYFLNTFPTSAFKTTLKNTGTNQYLDGSAVGWPKIEPSSTFPSDLKTSPGLREIFGVQLKPNESTIVPNSERTGGGSVRPSTGMIYPRKV